MEEKERKASESLEKQREKAVQNETIRISKKRKADEKEFSRSEKLSRAKENSMLSKKKKVNEREVFRKHQVCEAEESRRAKKALAHTKLLTTLARLNKKHEQLFDKVSNIIFLF